MLQADGSNRRIWLVTIGETVPINEGRNDRPFRAGYLAKLLSASGWNVVWWTSTFDHYRKKHLFKYSRTVNVAPRLQINLLHGIGYRKNVSFSRLLDHSLIAKKFSKWAPKYPPPDIILCSLPPIKLSLNAVLYGSTHNVPVILDMRDMWPDIFIDVFPKWAKPAAKFGSLPMFAKARRACANATAITGITNEYVEWGLKRGCRVRSEKDKAFYIGYPSLRPKGKPLEAAKYFWERQGIRCNDKELTLCFFGSLGRQFDIATVIRAISKLEKQNKKIRFVICGKGDRETEYKQLAKGSKHIFFPGWINATQILELMNRSDIGIDPMPDRNNFVSGINNKAIEYLSAGLPILSSPKRGSLFKLLQEYQCGRSYANGDIEGLIKLLLEFDNNRQKSALMSNNAKTLFNHLFSTDKVYPCMIKYLADIAKIESRKFSE